MKMCLSLSILFLSAASAALFTLPLYLPAPYGLEILEFDDPSFLSPMPMTGVMEPNDRMANASVLLEGRANKPETAYVNSKGIMYAFDEDATLWKIDTQDPNATGEAVTQVSGRPLGLVEDAAGNIIFANPAYGIGMIEFDTKREIVLLSRLPDGSPIRYADDIDISPTTGKLYLADATSLPPILGPGEEYYELLTPMKQAFFHGGATGRLIEYDPSSGNAEVIADGFNFINGVSVSADGTYAIASDSGRLCIYRVELEGPHRGAKTVIAKNLPAFSDGGSRSSDGNFWLALPSPLPGTVKQLQSKVLRFMVSHMPEFMQPKAVPSGVVIKMSPQGEILESLHDPTAERVHFITGVAEFSGKLYLASLHKSGVSVVAL